MDLNSCSLCFSSTDLWPLLNFPIQQGMGQKRLKEAVSTVLRRPGPSLPAGAERERNCYGTTPSKNTVLYTNTLLNRGGNM